MQDQPLPFDLTIDHPTPWETRVFVLYILVVLAFLLVRTTQLTVFLWRYRKARNASPSPDSPGTAVRDLHLASIKALSLRRAMILTLLVSIAISAERTVAVLREVSALKIYGPGFVGGSGAETLTVLAIGMVVCCMLYAAYAFFDGQLSRLTIKPKNAENEN